VKYTKTELKWLENLVDKAVIEATMTLEQMNDHPARALVQLNHDNMASLREKLRKDIQRHINRAVR
jgi:hypothetical protein